MKCDFSMMGIRISMMLDDNVNDENPWLASIGMTTPNGAFALNEYEMFSKDVWWFENAKRWYYRELDS